MVKVCKPFLLSVSIVFLLMAGCGDSDKGTVVGSGDMEGIEAYRAMVDADEANQKSLDGK
ncbi:hypothetical protein [Neorhodopirellula lusitana]|uniref:hypothetical protein n=1 Tax=Neorhodopirellula lusitana TaxID=445327 RepID=UPI003851713D